MAAARRYKTPKIPSTIAAMIAKATRIRETLESSGISVAPYMVMSRVKFKLCSGLQNRGLKN